MNNEGEKQQKRREKTIQLQETIKAVLCSILLPVMTATLQLGTVRVECAQR